MSSSEHCSETLSPRFRGRVPAIMTPTCLVLGPLLRTQVISTLRQGYFSDPVTSLVVY